MTADDCIAVLGRARSALDEHYRAYDKALGGSRNELGVEARKRIGQMIWLVSEVGKLLSEADEGHQLQRKLGDQLESGQLSLQEWSDRIQSSEMRAVSKRFVELSEALETLTEAFYWIAGRARGAIRDLPNMGSFKAEGVRNVRNKLLEHPNGKDSGVLMTSFGWGADVGPVVKALRLEHQADAWPDKGLFVNAFEFAEELSRKAENAVKAAEI